MSRKLYLAHEGVGHDDNPPGRGSGRYAWGSGHDPYQHGFNFMHEVDKIKKEFPQYTEAQIMEKMGMSSTEWRARQSFYSEGKKYHDRIKAVHMRDGRQMSPKNIAQELGISESTVRNYLKDSNGIKNQEILNTMNVLKENLDKYKYIDIGDQTEELLGVSKERLRAAYIALKDEGYVVSKIQVDQINPKIKGQKTDMLILGKPGQTESEQSKDVYANLGDVHYINEYYSEDNGLTYGQMAQKPKALSMDRIEIKYADKDGYQPKDGVIEIRPGVQDLYLGDEQVYSQVRINVEDKYYLKGMAIYSYDLPDGVDVRFNTNKAEGTKPEKVFKKLKTTRQLEDGSDDPTAPIDWDNPFGAAIKPMAKGGQRFYTDENGKQQLSLINKVNEEGTWDGWRRTIPSQFLSKQPQKLIENQLEITRLKKEQEFDEINKITNDVIRKKKLMDFADSCDEDAADLRAWSFPRQTTKVLLPNESLKENECYCPSYKDGEKLILVRYPHGGPREILQVTVNNKNKECKKLFGVNRDAIIINPTQAPKLSGADFDGDSVTCIPDKYGFKVEKLSKYMEGFDAKTAYYNPDLPRMTDKAKQTEMGKAENLKADMMLIGCTEKQWADVNKYSQVVIDAQKHSLDYKQAAKDFHIKEYREEFQKKAQGGGVTIITRAGGEVDMPEESLRIDTQYMKETGNKRYIPTGKTHWVPKGNKTDPETGRPLEWKEVQNTTKKKRMDTKEDAWDLVSDRDNPYKVEVPYANYANQMKELARKSRLTALDIEKTPRDTAATQVYEEEVKSLESKLKARSTQAPADRLALRLATVQIKAIKEENPNITSAQLKKKSAQALTTARTRVYEGGRKEKIQITEKEWEAIQAKAISDTMLEKILRYADDDQVLSYAKPQKERGKAVSTAELALIRSYKNKGYNWSDISERLGIPESTIKRYYYNE